MADVIRTKDQFKMTFTLQNVNDENTVVTRELSFDVVNPISDSATQKLRFAAFRATYMEQLANKTYTPEEGDAVSVGSLIQPTNFRDDVTTDPSSGEELVDVYKCTDITGAYVTTVERIFDTSA